MGSMERERRTEARMLCADMVEIRWRDRSGKHRKATALLEDISSSGACLQLEAPIPLGAEIGWEAPGQFFSGYIRYCVYREIGYFAGVEFGKSTKWSEKTYAPQHLLDLEKLVARKDSKATVRASTVLTRSRG
jgi:hypothetical protein